MIHYCTNCKRDDKINTPMIPFEPPKYAGEFEWFQCTRFVCNHKALFPIGKDTK